MGACPMSQSQFAMGSSSSVLLWSFSCIHLSLTCVLFRLSGGVCGLELWILEVRGSSLARCVVSLDKDPYSTLSIFTFVYK